MADQADKTFYKHLKAHKLLESDLRHFNTLVPRKLRKAKLNYAT